MATYGAGIRIDSNVNANRSSNGTVYTVPAGKALIGQVSFDGAGNVQVNIDSKNLQVVGATTASAPILIHAGPGSVISMQISSGTPQVNVSGILYSN